MQQRIARTAFPAAALAAALALAGCATTGSPSDSGARPHHGHCKEMMASRAAASDSAAHGPRCGAAAADPAGGHVDHDGTHGKK